MCAFGAPKKVSDPHPQKNAHRHKTLSSQGVHSPSDIVGELGL